MHCMSSCAMSVVSEFTEFVTHQVTSSGKLPDVLTQLSTSTIKTQRGAECIEETVQKHACSALVTTPPGSTVLEGVWESSS